MPGAQGNPQTKNQILIRLRYHCRFYLAGSPPVPETILTAKDRDAIAQLQLLARGVVEGITAGRHRSPHKGSSIEFKEHRQYVRGDEIRSIDWKLFGKTDRLYIRQYEDETNLRSMILLDQSGSMGYRGSRSAIYPSMRLRCDWPLAWLRS